MTDPKRPRDTNQLAKAIVDLATEDRVVSVPDHVTPQALGGKRRAESLSSSKKTEIAKKAAAARWLTKPQNQSS